MRRLAPALLALSTLLAVQGNAEDVTLHYIAEEITDSLQRPSYAQSRSYSIVPIGTADDDSVTTYSVELAVSLKAWVDESTTSSVTDDPVQTETFTLVEGASTMGYDDINTQVVTSTLTNANGQPTGTTTDSWAAGVSEACQFDADASVGSCIMHLAYDTGLESDGVTFTGSLAPFYTLSADDNGAGATRGLPASFTALCSMAAGVGLGAWMTMAQAF
ncbi:hypothetical protein K523DRAFT_362245 [Schizophyllum commune Tattone D]|nr:hypothetical protein K523DRAFT_362245 [Schizophyllum commune Tattone D]